MAWMRGEPLVAKLATLAMYALPAAMVASVIYSPPDFLSSSKSSDQKLPK